MNTEQSTFTFEKIEIYSARKHCLCEKNHRLDPAECLDFYRTGIANLDYRSQKRVLQVGTGEHSAAFWHKNTYIV